MPRRTSPFVTGEIYHVFNRSVGKENIFSTKIYLKKILEIVNYYRFIQHKRLSQFRLLPDDKKQNYLSIDAHKKPLVELYAYAFMPNHYHLLVKQLSDNGIVTFNRIMQNSFARYFNTKNRRQGSLFQIQFKAKRIEDDEQFLHVSRYIHLNPVTHYIIEVSQLDNYPWTSFNDYINTSTDSIIQTKSILSFFKSKESYYEFIKDQVDYQRKLALLKDLLLE